MDPSDPRHGTLAGHRAHYRSDRTPCDECRRAVADYERDRRTRHYLRGELKVDGTGTRRRIQALMALGWDGESIDKVIGRSPRYTARLLSTRGLVLRSTADLYRAAYERLSMRIGPSDVTRRRARSNGWAPPLAWDDDAIDNPNARPHVPRTRDEKFGRNHVDPITVERVLLGENLPTTTAERREITRRWIASGGSEAALCRRMRWREGRYSERKAG